MDREQEDEKKPPCSPQPKSYPDCFGLPYQDHNYGAPPPPSPPNSTVLPPVKEEHSVKEEVVVEEDPVPVPEANVEVVQDQEKEDITRCICDFDHDDGYMICCDRCSVWQHVDCMGLDKTKMPDDYLCEICQPRNVDRSRARLLQKRKRQELADLSPSYSSDSDSSREFIVRRRKVTKKLQVQRNLKDEFSGVTKTCKRKSKERREGKRPLPMVKATPVEAKRRPEGLKREHRQKRRQSRSSEEEVCAESEMIKLRSWIEGYEQAITNHYSPELRARLTKLYSGNYNTIPPQVTHCCKVVRMQHNVKGLLSCVTLSDGDTICEIQGKYLLMSQWLEQNPQGSELYQPYLVFYTLPKDGTEVCVDARSYGNLARFVRRSCQPNAKVSHYMAKGSLHLVLVASVSIAPDKEITIPFDSKVDSGPCACGSLDCNPRNGVRMQKRRKRAMVLRSTSGEEDTDPDATTQTSELEGESTPSHETTETDLVPEKKKLTREERKLEAILKTIESLERQEQKKQEMSRRKEVKKRSPSSADEYQKQPRRKVRRTSAQASLAHRSRINSGSSDPTSADESETNTREFKFPKTKKSIMCEWLNEPRRTAPSVPTTTVTGSAKKRWLRQAISEENRPESPSLTDCGTPLKKRRLARESVASPEVTPKWDPISILSAVAEQEIVQSEDRRSVDKEEDDDDEKPNLKEDLDDVDDASTQDQLEEQIPKRKLSILEYRKRKQEVGGDKLSSEEEIQRTRHPPVLPVVEPMANNEMKYLQGESSWDSNPTLAERQRENLTERLRKEFNMFPDSA